MIIKLVLIMALNEIPVLLLTGYLGSGKTTLVNRILNNKKGVKFAVIVNDIGEVNIDASLIEQGGVVGQKDDSLVALQNGCICCTLKMDLVQQICDIVSQRKFDYIVIEASGICEPEPIAQTICSIPSMGVQFIKDGIARLDCIVTVVDALRMRDEFESGDSLVGDQIGEEDLESLVIQQIEFCNIILLNKASEVSPSELGKIKQIIRTLQPKAQIIECDYGEVDLDKILNTHLFDFEKVATSATWISKVEGGAPADDEVEHFGHEEHEHHDEDEHGHHHHDHDADEVFGSWGKETVLSFTHEELDGILKKLCEEESDLGVILRSKGIVRASDRDEWYYFDLVAGDYEIRTGSPDVIGRVVVIGSSLNKEKIRRLFDKE